MNIEEKIKIVENLLKDKKVAIGFSGGADSTLIAYLSSKVAKDTLAITINNHLLPTGFVENTEKVSKSFKIKHEIIDINFYENEEFLLNNTARCYNCRNLMYCEIEKTANEKGFDFICDGNNISDLVNDRPGILVTYKKGFNTPFIEAKLTSKEIHEYLNRNNIPYSRSTTCLATRIPTNTKTTKEKIKRISECEDFILKNTKCNIVKVRTIGNYGICEVDNLDEILNENKHKMIKNELKKRGFKKVALNLTEINDDEYIKIDYNNGNFSYKLPYTINIENSEKLLKDEIIFKNKKQIKTTNICINADGFINGKNFKSYDNALNAFMSILPKLRRTI